MTAREALEILRNLNLTTYPIEEAKQLLSCLGEVGCLVTTLQEGIVIHRIRPNLWGLYDEEQLKYCPVNKCIKAQRASLRGQTIFYGVVSNDLYSTQGAEFVGLYECTRLINKVDNNHQTDRCTFGEWVINRPIQLACVVNETLFENKKNVLLAELKESFQSLRITNEYFDEVQEFLCNEFAKKVEHDVEDYQYLISALFTNIVIDELHVDGVIYPPVRTEGAGGMNVAIKPSLIDDKSITLSNIRELEVFLHYKNAVVITRKYYRYPQLDVVYENTASNEEIWNKIQR